MSSEVTETRLLPTSASQRLTEAWHVYLDNYAQMVIRQRCAHARATAEISKWHAAVRAAWDRWGIPSAREKSVVISLAAKELGCAIDGQRGTLSTTVSRRKQAIGLSLFLGGTPALIGSGWPLGVAGTFACYFAER